MAVEIHDHVIGVRHGERCHGTRNDCAASVNDHDPRKRECTDAQFPQKRRAARNSEGHSPQRYDAGHREERRKMLPERQQRERVEQVADRRKHRVRR